MESLREFENAGVPADRVVVGIPWYGYDYHCDSESHHYHDDPRRYTDNRRHHNDHHYRYGALHFCHDKNHHHYC